MKKIVFASHDPGGCNLIIPIIDFIGQQPDYLIYLLVVGPAKQKVGKLLNSRVKTIEVKAIAFERFPNEYDVSQSEIREVLNKIEPDIILTTTSINSNVERYAIQYGKEFKLPTISYIDSWVGEDIRFKSDKLEVCPDYILVCDTEMKMPYLKFEGENCKVITVGNPHLEALAFEYQSGIFQEERDEDRVLFFCENIKHYYPAEEFNEISILKAILLAYNHPRKLNVVVRPHPLESKAHWIDFIKKSEGSNDFVTISLDHISDLRDSIKQSSLAFGVSSMALIEASIMGRYTFSFQVGVVRNKKFLYIPFEDYGIAGLCSIDEVCKELSLAGTKVSGYKGNHGSRVIDKVMNLLTNL